MNRIQELRQQWHHADLQSRGTEPRPKLRQGPGLVPRHEATQESEVDREECESALDLYRINLLMDLLRGDEEGRRRSNFPSSHKFLAHTVTDTLQ